MEQERLYQNAEPTRIQFNAKTISFFIIGFLTLIYCIIEIVVAIAVNSLTLLSDGFHNFSDVIALGIAFFAAQKANAFKTDRMTFGWARTEIIGGLVNGCFLLSLSLYIVLEAIPRLIPFVANPEDTCSSGTLLANEDDYYIGVAAAGLLLNTIGTITFHFTGQGHMHSHAGGGGHSHSHGGHGDHDDHDDHDDDDEDDHHGHSHSSGKKTPEGHGHSHSGGHGHSHGSQTPEKEEKGHGHSHSGGGHGHSHGSQSPAALDHDEEEEGHGHSHSGGHGHSHGTHPPVCQDDEEEEGHGHSHSGGHGHSHAGKSPASLGHDEEEEEEGHGHSHSGGHGHSHSGKKEKRNLKEDEVGLLQSDYQLSPEPYNAYSVNGEEPVGVEVPKKKKKPTKDMNVYAVFLHYLGDMLSSFFVLVAGLMMKYIKQTWTIYLDPIFSLLIVGIILFTTYPMVKNCCLILLQFVPRHINLAKVNQEIEDVPGVKGAHDLHIWQLVDGMDIGTVHVIIDHNADVKSIFHQIKDVFHHVGVHSSVIQPEFSDIVASRECLENCVQSCEENWCCKKESEQEKKKGGSYSV